MIGRKEAADLPPASNGASASMAIRVEHVHKVFRNPGRPPTVALRDVTLDVGEGSFVVLVGASGCGKTTLLRLLAGLERATRGKVSLFGEPVEKPTGQASMLFQSSVLLPWRTIISNVLLPAEIAGHKQSEWRERAMSLLDKTGLAGFADHYPRELSGGMRQRAAICRALLLDPPILFMDEPFGALDAITRSSMNKELYETWAKTGKTIVFVTHDISEAVRLGTQIAVMNPRPGHVARVIDVDIPESNYTERIASPQYHEHVVEAERLIATVNAEHESSTGDTGIPDAK